MELIGFVPIMIYAVLIGFWFIWQEQLFQKGTPASIIMFASGIGSGLLVIAALLRGTRFPSEASWWLWLAANVACGIVLCGCLIGATKASGAALGANSMALAPVLAIFTGWAFLGRQELPGYLTIIGILVTFGGVYVLNVNPARHNGFLGPFYNMMHGQWLFLTLGVTVSAGVAFPIEKRLLLDTDALMAPGMSLFFAWGIFWGTMALWRGDFRGLSLLTQHHDWWRLGGVMVTLTLANGFQSVALYYGSAAAVGAAKRLFAPVTVLLAWWILKQKKNLPNLLAGSVLIFSGAILMALDKMLR